MKKLFALLLAFMAIGCSSTAEVSTPLPTREGQGGGSAAGGASSFSTRTYPLSDFSALDVSSVVKVIYTQGDTYSVSLTGRAEWLDKMEVKATRGKLHVALKVGEKLPNNIRSKDQPDGQHNFILRLTAPRLEDICITGVSTFQATSMKADKLNVTLRGVSKLKADNITATNFNMRLSGCSEIHASAITCETYSTEISGASKIDIKKLSALVADAQVFGASKVALDAVAITEKATFDVRGASKLTLAATGGDLCKVNVSGASKGDIRYTRGGSLSATCKGASKLEARLDCQSVNAKSDGASKITLSGTADKVEVDRGGVATSIDTSRLNQF